VEDVLSLGQEIQVVVDEIDEKGKVSLSPVGLEIPESAVSGGGNSGDALWSKFRRNPPKSRSKEEGEHHK
jgi:polyribonucleotide nucleotidyltransferase